MYTSYFGLTAKPFQLGPDPHFLFPSPGHKGVLSELRYALSQREGFIILTGGAGTGKTLLTRSLSGELDGEVDIVGLDAVFMEEEDFIGALLRAFATPDEASARTAAYGELNARLGERARTGRQVLLIVDEAQNLSGANLEALRVLSNYQLGGVPVLQVMLVGRDELQALGNEPLELRTVACCHLEPLSLATTREYIEHRLRVAGWQGDPIFTADAYRAIHHQTRGVPGRINRLCDRLLLHGFIEQAYEFPATVVDSVSATLPRISAPEAALRKEAKPTAVRAMASTSSLSALEQVGENLAPEQRTAEQESQIQVLETRIRELEAMVRMFRQGFG